MNKNIHDAVPTYSQMSTVIEMPRIINGTEDITNPSETIRNSNVQ